MEHFYYMDLNVFDSAIPWLHQVQLLAPVTAAGLHCPGNVWIHILGMNSWKHSRASLYFKRQSSFIIETHRSIAPLTSEVVFFCICIVKEYHPCWLFFAVLGIKALHLWTAGCSMTILVVNHVTWIRVTSSPVLNAWRVGDLHANLRASPLLAESVFGHNTIKCVQF